MPINKRISSTTTLHDNVIASNPKAKDSRGVFDPKKDPLGGSIYDGISDEVDVRASVISMFGYISAEREDTPAPDELRTQDLLAQVRISRNNCSVEKRYRDRIVSPLSAVRAYCVTVCQSGSVKSVGQCTNISCPLWAFRLGTNGMRGKQ